MYRAGALTGQLEAEDLILAQAKRYGDKPTVKRIEAAKPAKLSKKTQAAILEFSRIDGSDWADYYERQIRDIYKTAMMDDQPLEDVQEALHAVFRSEVVLLERDADTFARATTDAQRERDRKNRANARIWRKQQKELADWRAGKTNEPPWRLEARQNTTRMRTGWNRWYTNQAVAKAESDSAVVGFAFTLGAAKNHTETCLSRSRINLIVRKGTAAERANRPPLHWGCKSRYIPLTRKAMKTNDLTFTSPGERKTVDAPEAGFGGAKKLPK